MRGHSEIIFFVTFVLVLKPMLNSRRKRQIEIFELKLFLLLLNTVAVARNFLKGFCQDKVVQDEISIYKTNDRVRVYNMYCRIYIHRVRRNCKHETACILADITLYRKG